MPRANPKDRVTDRLFGGKPQAPEATYESKLKDAHTKYFQDAKKRSSGTYTATETGARALAERRREYFAREVNKEYKKQGKAKQIAKISREVA